jgi:predicted nucleotidyltransferase
VNPILEKKALELQEICRRRQVQRLLLFGSAARGSFDPASSDLDFIVQFPKLSPAQHAECYFSLLEDLERLFGCSVDLVEPEPIRNPYFRQAVEQSQELIYAAP